MIFLFATEMEALPLRRVAPHAQIVICGVGSAECAAATAQVIEQMRQSSRFDRLVLAGIAGSYNVAQIPHGEVVEVIEERIYSLPERFARSYKATPFTSLRPVSSNSVNSSFEGEICSGAHPQIENMEGAAFMAVCERFGVLCTQIRAISNIVGEPFEQWQIQSALEALTRELVAMEATARS